MCLWSLTGPSDHNSHSTTPLYLGFFWGEIQCNGLKTNTMILHNVNPQNPERAETERNSHLCNGFRLTVSYMHSAPGLRPHKRQQTSADTLKCQSVIQHFLEALKTRDQTHPTGMKSRALKSMDWRSRGVNTCSSELRR